MMILLLLLFLLVPLQVVGQSLDRAHLNYINPLEYGANCDVTTLSAAITNISTNKATLYLTKTNRAKAACTWTIASDITFDIGTTVHIPSGVSLIPSSGITITFNGPVIVDDPEALQGDGSYIFNYPQSNTFASYIVSGCTPVVPTTSLTINSFACKAGLTLTDQHFNIFQPAIPLGPLSAGAGTYWLLIDFSKVRAIAGWTRQSGTHYLWQLAASQPAAPAGSIVFSTVTVSAGIIQTVSNVQSLGRTAFIGSFIFSQLPATGTIGRLAYVTDPVAITARGMWKDYGAPVGWQPLLGNILNVNDFGAVADSTGTGDGTDSTVGIQTAITIAMDMQGAVYLPAKREKCYRTTATLTATLPGAGVGLKIYGDGTHSVICGSPGTGSDVLFIDGTISGKNPIQLEDFVVYGTASSRDGIVLKNLAKPTIKHVFVIGARSVGWNIQGSIIGTMLGGGTTYGGIGSPGDPTGVAAVPVVGGLLQATAAVSGTDGWAFIGTSWNGAGEAANTITNASNTTPIQITVNAGHTLSANSVVYVSGVGGNTAANGTWSLTLVSTNVFNLVQPTSVGNGAYTTGGTATRGTQLQIRATSYGNTFVGGGICPGVIGIHLEAGANLNNFVGIDTSDCSGSNITDAELINGGVTASSYSGDTVSGNTRISGRVFVSGSDTSTFFPDDGSGKLGIKRISAGLARFFGIGTNVGVQVQAAGTGSIALRSDGTGADTGAGGTDALTVQTGPTVAIPGAIASGSATGRRVLCIDNTTKVLYISATSVDCTN